MANKDAAFWNEAGQNDSVAHLILVAQVDIVLLRTMEHPFFKAIWSLKSLAVRWKSR